MLKRYKKKDGSSSWRFIVYFNGIRYTETLPTKKLAKEFEAKRLLEIKDGKYLPPKKKKQLQFEKAEEKRRLQLSGLANGFSKCNLEKYANPGMIKCSIARLKEFFGETPIHLIRRMDIERYKEERMAGKGIFKNRKPVGPRPVNCELALARRIIKWAIEFCEYNIQRNPFVAFKRVNELETRRIPHRVTVSEMEQLLTASDEQFKPVLLTAWHTGMRKTEILTLKKSDVCDTTLISGQQYRFFQLRRTKAGRPREVPICDSLYESLRLLLESGTDSPYLFQWHGKCLDARKRFYRALKDAGLEDIQFHDFRRTFISMAMSAKHPDKVIATIVGHRLSSMTSLYQIPSREEMKTCVEAIPTTQIEHKTISYDT